MLCSKCGRVLPDAVKVCPACGTPVTSLGKVPSKEERGSAEEPPLNMPPVSPLPEEKGKNVPPLLKEQPKSGGKRKLTEDQRKLAEKNGLVVLSGGLHTSGEQKNVQEKPPPDEEKPQSNGKKEFMAITSFLPLLILLTLICGFLLYRAASESDAVRVGLEEAGAALQQGNYEDAILLYNRLLSLYPENAEAQTGLSQAQNLQLQDQAEQILLTLAKAETYLREGNFSMAQRLLGTLQLPEGDPNLPRLISLQEIADLNPGLEEVNPDSFPSVAVTLACGTEVTLEEVSVQEDGIQRAITDFLWQGEQLFLNYQTDEDGPPRKYRRVSVTISRDDYRFTCSDSYEVPSFQPAKVELVFADVSSYPTVKACLRVEGKKDGDAVAELEKRAFSVQERLSDEESYQSREIQSAVSLQKVGVGISLVVDRSSSVQERDLQKLKGILTQFVQSLRYDIGDCARVLAFDGELEELCGFCNSSTPLVSGIEKLTAGKEESALYQAIYDGIQAAVLQGGPRCAVIFAMGQDSIGPYDVEDLSRCAVEGQVPVYLIGTKEVDAEAFTPLTEASGGQYWSVHDLYELQQILSEIYDRQKELYQIEYVSDIALTPSDLREWKITATGGGFHGTTTVRFPPVYQEE